MVINANVIKNSLFYIYRNELLDAATADDRVLTIFWETILSGLHTVHFLHKYSCFYDRRDLLTKMKQLCTLYTFTSKGRSSFEYFTRKHIRTHMWTLVSYHEREYSVRVARGCSLRFRATLKGNIRSVRCSVYTQLHTYFNVLFQNYIFRGLNI